MAVNGASGDPVMTADELRQAFEPLAAQFESQSNALNLIALQMEKVSAILGVIAEQGKRKEPEQEGPKDKDPEWLKTFLSWSKSVNSAAILADGVGTGLASNRYANSASSLMKATASRLSKQGPFGKAAGAVVGVFDTIITAGVRLTNAFNERAKELARYSPEIAYAEAMNNYKATMADIREAQTMGKTLAGISSTSTDIWIEIRDLLLPIKKVVAETLLYNLKVIADALKEVNDIKNMSWGDVAEKVLDVTLMGFMPSVALIKNAIDYNGDKVTDAIKEEDKGNQNIWDDLMNNIPKMPGAGPLGAAVDGRGDWDAPARNQGLRVPIFGGV
jgi:hypothetical protein